MSFIIHKEGVTTADVTKHLQDKGYCYAPFHLGDYAISELVTYLDQCQVYNAHVPARQTAPMMKLADVKAAGQWPMCCHRVRDVLAAPFFWEVALAGYPIAKDYFNEEPLLYSINTFWSQPAPSTYFDTHGWHRDGDDRKQLGMFMYGRDVIVEDDGVHKVQCGTHRGDAAVEAMKDDPNYEPSKLHGALDAHLGRPQQIEPPPDQEIASITGFAGTCFFTDPAGIHIGVRPRKPRMFAWARWGVSDPPSAYVWDKTQPMDKAVLGHRYPQDPVLQHAVRLLVR